MEIRLNAQQEALLEQTAQRRNCSKEEVASEAITAYLEHDEWFRDAVQRGREEVQRGDLVEHQDVGRGIEERFRTE